MHFCILCDVLRVRLVVDLRTLRPALVTVLPAFIWQLRSAEVSSEISVRSNLSEEESVDIYLHFVLVTVLPAHFHLATPISRNEQIRFE